MNRRWSRLAMYGGLIVVLAVVVVLYFTGHH
jgi:hypothetical protein